MGRSNKKHEDTQTTKLISTVEKLVQLKTAELETPTPAESHLKLKYMSIYNNLDRMLCKLPEPVVEDLNMRIMSLVYEEIRKLGQ
jgi:hypothetical protein